MPKSRKRILILAGDADYNLGDRAIVFSMCREFRRIIPNVEIQIVSSQSGLDGRFFEADSIRRGPLGLAALAATAGKSDLVFCGGGGLFQDDDSLVKMAYWAARLAFVRLFCKKIIGYSLGVGPLRWPSSRFFARVAFSCMDSISVRDHKAKETSEKLTSKPIHIVPDPALLLPSGCQQDATRLLKENGIPLDGSPLIGVAVRRWFHHRPTIIPHKYAVRYNLRTIPGREKCRKMTSLLAGVLDKMVREHGAYISFMPTYNVSHEADHEISEEIMEKMKSRRISLMLLHDPRIYKAVCGRLNLMMGGRMHPTILSASAGTSIVGLSYNQKFLGFFELLGLQDKVINVDDFVNNELSEDLVSVLSDAITDGTDPLARVGEITKDIRTFNESILSGLR